MRISLIHGENSPLAYEKYRKLIDGSKSKGFEIVNISDIHKIVSQSLFEEKIVFTLEKPNKVKLLDWKWLSKNAPKYNSNLLIFYEGNAPVGITKNLPKDIKIEKFDLPKILFSFLDSFNLKVFNDLLKIEPVELVFHLLARRLRDLYWVKVSPETLQMQDWQKSKLISQANKFTTNNLQLIINELAEIDVKSKTSDADLKSSLDILIIKYLK